LHVHEVILAEVAHLVEVTHLEEAMNFETAEQQQERIR
jgi:hypothetical protein